MIKGHHTARSYRVKHSPRATINHATHHWRWPAIFYPGQWLRWWPAHRCGDLSLRAGWYRRHPPTNSWHNAYLTAEAPDLNKYRRSMRTYVLSLSNGTPSASLCPSQPWRLSATNSQHVTWLIYISIGKKRPERCRKNEPHLGTIMLQVWLKTISSWHFLSRWVQWLNHVSQKD